MATLKENLVKFAPQTVIFRENDFTRDIYIIKKGSVNLYKKIGNKTVLLARVEPGGVLGELSMIDGGSRSATAIAIDDVQTVKITPVEFKEGLKNVPEWFMGIARVLTQRIRLTDSRLNASGPLVNEANITAILIHLLHDNDTPSGISQSMVENTLIELLNLPLNEIQTALDTLARKKLISAGQGTITSDFVEKLEEHLKSLRTAFTQTVAI